MTTTEHTNLNKLLDTYFATFLGQGNVTAGANLLATMAVTIANCAKHGSHIKDPSLGKMHIGTSVLIHGSMSAGLVRDNIIIEAGALQNNLLEHIRQYVHYNSVHLRQDAHKKISGTERAPVGSIAEKMIILGDNYSKLNSEQLAGFVHTAMITPAHSGLDGLTSFPRFMITARNSQDLNKQYKGLHSHQPLIVMSLNSPEDADDLSQTCAPLLHGLYPAGDAGDMTHARFIVSDPAEHLTGIIAKNSPHSSWINHLVWLTDRVSDTDLKLAEANEFPISPIQNHFGLTLSRLLAYRLNPATSEFASHNINLTQAQLRWVKYLEKMEYRLPGISGSARGLLVTLAFGLTELGQTCYGKEHVIVPEQVEAFAKWIILRMADNKDSITINAHRQKLRLHAERIIEMLVVKGSLSTRDIYRQRTLPADNCRALLFAMEKAGLVEHDGDSWACASKSKAENYDYSTLCIEV